MTSSTLEVHSLLIPPEIHELLSMDMLQCIQIETKKGFLIKVVPPELDPRSCPPELQEIIDAARLDGNDWILIDYENSSIDWKTRFVH